MTGCILGVSCTLLTRLRSLLSWLNFVRFDRVFPLLESSMVVIGRISGRSGRRAVWLHRTRLHTGQQR